MTVALFPRGEMAELFVQELKDTVPGLKAGSVIIYEESYLSRYSVDTVIEFKVSESIETSVRGYFFEATEHSELIESFSIGLSSVGIPPYELPPFTLLPKRNDGVRYIMVNLGFSTNSKDMQILATQMDKVVLSIMEEIQVPQTYERSHDTRIRSIDPYMEKDGYAIDEYYESVGSSATLYAGKYTTIPINFLRIKSADDDHLTMVKTGFTAVDYSQPHVLIFTARVADTIEDGVSVPLEIYQGNSYFKYNLTNKEWNTFVFAFTPGYTKRWENLTSVTLQVMPKDYFSYPVSVNVRGEQSYVRTHTVPCEVNTVFPLDMYIGVRSKTHVDITGFCIYDEGVLGSLDDPRQIYTPFPGRYEAYKSTGDGDIGSNLIAESVSNTSSPQQINPAVTEKGSSKLFFDKLLTGIVSSSEMQAALLSTMSFANSQTMETIIKNYTEIISPLVSTINSIAGGKLSMDPKSLLLDTGVLEIAISKASLSPKQKGMAMQVLTKMQIISRGKDHAISELKNTAIDLVMKDKTTKEFVRKMYEESGKVLKDATNALNTAQEELRRAANLSSLVSFDVENAISVTQINTGNPLVDVLLKEAARVTANELLDQTTIQDFFYEANKIDMRLQGWQGQVTRQLSSQIAGVDYTNNLPSWR